jgi:hypothetical protein
MSLYRIVSALCAAVVFASAGPAGAEESKPVIPVQPVKNAAAEEIARLVRELGDDAFDVREAATKRLTEIGRPALAALREAAKSGEAEVSSRAARIVAAIEKPAQPAKPGHEDGQVIIGGIGIALAPAIIGPARVIGRAGPGGVAETITEENGRKVRIKQSAEGILVEVTEAGKDGKSVTRKFEGKDADDLKKNSEEGFELFKKYGGGNRGVEVRAAPAAPVGGFVIVDDDVPPAGGARVTELDEALRSHLGVTGGALVREVEAGSAADRLGLRKFDVVLKIDGRDVEGPKALIKALSEDGRRTIEGVRAGKPFKIGPAADGK